MEPIPQPKAYHRLFQPLEPGKMILRSQLFYFFALLGITTLLTKNCAPVQSSKIFFLSITLHFFFNFFYAFEVKTELEVFRKRHYSLIFGICLSMGLVFGVDNPGFFFVIINVPFWLMIAGQLYQPRDSKWKVLMLCLNVVLVLLFTCYSPSYFAKGASEHISTLSDAADTVDTDTTATLVPAAAQTLVQAPQFFYVNWSLLLMAIVALCAYVCITHYDKPHENVFHLGNLVDFVLISFLPFLFVLQKAEVPPMETWVGYICLIPTVICLAVAIGLGYFFLANMKPFQLYSLVNLLTAFFIFISCNVLNSLYAQIVCFCVLVVLVLNFPLKNFTVIVDSYYGAETTEENLKNKERESEDRSHDYSYNNKSKFPILILLYLDFGELILTQFRNTYSLKLGIY